VAAYKLKILLLKKRFAISLRHGRSDGVFDWILYQRGNTAYFMFCGVDLDGPSLPVPQELKI